MGEDKDNTSDHSPEPYPQETVRATQGEGVGYSRFGILLAHIMAGTSPGIISQPMSGVKHIDLVGSPGARGVSRAPGDYG